MELRIITSEDRAFIPRPQEATADGALWVWDQSVLQREFRDSQGYAERPYLGVVGKEENASLVDIFKLENSACSL